MARMLLRAKVGEKGKLDCALETDGRKIALEFRENFRAIGLERRLIKSRLFAD